MSTLIFTLIALIYLTTGRRLYALKQCLEIAKAAALPALVSLIEEAIAHDIETVALENAWVRSRKLPRARGRSVQIDNKIDALIGIIYATLSNNLSAFEPDDPIYAASSQIVSQLFREGVQPIITLPFEEQLVQNQTIIDRLTGDLGEAATATHIEPYVARMALLNDAFRSELGQSQTKEIAYDALEAARDRGNLYIRQIIALVLGTFYNDTEADAASRQALLKPFLDQEDRIRRSRKGRRPPQDVDPETGEEVIGDEDAA